MAILVKKLLPWHHVVASDMQVSEKVNVRLASFGIQVVEKSLLGGGNPLPFNNERFDVCLFLEVFEHVIEDPKYVLCELYRILRNKGLLFFTTPNLAHIYNRFRLLIGKQPQLFLSGIRRGCRNPRGHFREWVMEELVSLIQDSGFHIIDTKYIDAVGSTGMVGKNPLLIPLYYPYKALVTTYPTFRSQIAIVSEKRKNLLDIDEA